MSIEKLVTVKRSKRAKRIALRLDPVERVMNLVVPHKMPLHKAYYFAQEHEAWVRENLARVSNRIIFTDGVEIPLFGENVKISVDRSKLYRKTTISRGEYELYVSTPLEDPSDKIKAFLKKHAREGLAEMASEKAGIIHRTITAVNVRDTKSRWGSCAQDGSLSFSWRLIFAPYDAIDYVVAHEVAHLRHMNHSASFWELCESLSDNYTEGKEWMRKNGSSLMMYG